jgi:hypothetical protein
MAFVSCENLQKQNRLQPFYESGQPRGQKISLHHSSITRVHRDLKFLDFAVSFIA